MKNVIRKIILVISIIIFIVSSFFLIKILVLDKLKNNNTNNEIREIYYENQEDSPKRLHELAAINSDIKAWIKIPNTVIDYPVLKPSKNDPEYYLHRNYKKEYSKYGSIFIDANSSEDVNSKNIIVHGHNMNDGSMFNNILKFTDLNFYKTTPTFSFDTLYEESMWKIISVFRTNTLAKHGEVFNYLRGDFLNKEDFLKFIKDITNRSLINTTVDINSDDQLITLSTCSYEFEDFRTVVVARKVRNGESTYVDVDKAVVNPNPILPKCYEK